MKISHKWLQTFFKKPLPSSEEISRLLTFHIFEVEGIEKKTNDDILDVKVLPDRASYCLCHQGVARELSALLKDNEFVPRVYVFDDNTPDVEKNSISVEAGDVCDSYNTIHIIGGSKLQSPDWLVTKLNSVGQRSINFYADLSNFIMLDIGQPMHVFDKEKVVGDIVVRYAREGEKITTLDNKEIELNSNICVIADDMGPLAVAGIKGGNRAETTNHSKNLIVEAAHFDSSIIRKISNNIGIKTDSSKRFENGLSGELAQDALNYFASIMKKEDPEILVSEISSAGVKYKKETKIEFDSKFISNKLGKEIDTDTIINLLNTVYIHARREGAGIAVYPTDDRKDLRIPEDIVDEIGRLYGYENIEGIVPRLDIKASINSEIGYRNIVRNFLINKGFCEVQTYSLTDYGEEEIINPLASDKKFLRTNLQNSIENKLKSNLYYADLLGLSKINIFEFGRVWKGGKEFVSLCVGIAHKKPKKDDRPNDEIKLVRDELFSVLGVDVQVLCTIDDTGGILTKNGKQIGVTNNSDGIMEINFDDLISDLPKLNTEIKVPVSKEVIKYKSPSPYPFVVRDIAVFVPGDKNNEDEVWKVISKSAGDLLVRHELFDVFEKKNKDTSEVEKTSFAFRLVFQSYDKTLTDEEVNKIMSHITEAVAGMKWEVR